MLFRSSQIYSTARRILSRSPSTQAPSSEARESPPTSHAPEPDVAMVTTRRGTDTPGNQATPLSSAKKRVGKRELDALDTPSSVKRQRRAVPQSKPSQPTEEVIQDSEDDGEDTITLEVPSAAGRKAEGKLPIRRRSSLPEVDTPERLRSQNGEETSTPRARRASARHKNMQPEAVEGAQEIVTETNEPEEEIPSVEEPVPEEPAAEELVEEPVEDEHAAEKITAEESTDSAPLPAQKPHKRFGSEEPIETIPTSTMNTQGYKRYEAPEDDDSASDSDEAPEVVTTSAAASKAAATQADTERAHLALQEKERAKREAREARIALEQAEKRKREEKKAKKLARKAAREQMDIDAEDDADQEDDAAVAIDRKNLPALLPDSLLASLPSQRAPTPPPTRPGMTDEQRRREKLNHHVKFLERAEKGPKDVKKGKLNVSVLRGQNAALPPKVSRGSRGVREHWLKGRNKDFKKGGKKNVVHGKMERRAFGQTGFVRGDD